MHKEASFWRLGASPILQSFGKTWKGSALPGKAAMGLGTLGVVGLGSAAGKQLYDHGGEAAGGLGQGLKHMGYGAWEGVKGGAEGIFGDNWKHFQNYNQPMFKQFQPGGGWSNFVHHGIPQAGRDLWGGAGNLWDKALWR